MNFAFNIHESLEREMFECPCVFNLCVCFVCVCMCVYICVCVCVCVGYLQATGSGFAEYCDHLLLMSYVVHEGEHAGTKHYADQNDERQLAGA